MRNFLIALLLLAVATLGLAAYMGVFLAVQISEEEAGPYQLVYRPVDQVDFEEVGRITDEIATLLDNLEINDRAPMQVYYPEGHAEIGFVVNDEIRSLRLSNGTTLKTIPREAMMAVEFPWRNPGSFMLGFLKVNPALQQHREQQGYRDAESMTVYKGSTILYLQPARQ